MKQFDIDDNDFPIDSAGLENIVEIDLESINKDSEKEAKDILETVSSLFMDEKFKERHPQVRKRIKLELDTLRGLIKMRKTDEEAHDAIILAISENKSNASLYRSLAELQKTSIQISNKIHDTMDRLNNICKGFQLELPFEEFKDEEDDSEEPNETSKVHRGTKDFIKEMIDKD